MQMLGVLTTHLSQQQRLGCGYKDWGTSVRCGELHRTDFQIAHQVRQYPDQGQNQERQYHKSDDQWGMHDIDLV
jgi:hypothetical protein